MTDYDPFARGPHPVGVRTAEVSPAGRAESDVATIPVEIWYPARDSALGKDLDPATQDSYSLAPGLPEVAQAAVRDAQPSIEATSGTAPAVVFSHGFAGHRRQSTHLTAHLASHGYVVIAPDHVGNTTPEVMGWAMGIGAPDDMVAYTRDMSTQRVNDAITALDALLAGEFAVSASSSSVGMSGHSFGGWTTLATASEDERIRATLPLAPAGGDGGVWDGPQDPRAVMRSVLDQHYPLEWGRDVPTLTLVADLDSVLPYPMMTELLANAPAIEELVVLVNSDHFHFSDGVEVIHDFMTGAMGDGSAKPYADLVPGDAAYSLTTGLGLAHFDATLRGQPAAAAFIDQDRAALVALLADRGIVVEVVTGETS
ncbi:MAG: dienelactone hydrolase family protein [Actinomycetota bacterium]